MVLGVGNRIDHAVEAGATLSFSLFVVDDTGQAVDLTEATLRAQVRPDVGADAVGEFAISTGGATQAANEALCIWHTDATLPTGAYVYDVRATFQEGSTMYPAGFVGYPVNGSIIVENSVTEAAE